MIMGRLVELQDLLGPRRDDVSILSISADPVLDTPQALHAYAESLQAGPGWYFLTGAKDAVDIVLDHGDAGRPSVTDRLVQIVDGCFFKTERLGHQVLTSNLRGKSCAQRPSPTQN